MGILIKVIYMSSNDIVKYLTQEFVRFIDTPKENRKKKQKESWASRWFGMIPMSFKVFWGKWR
jgi:hypothetical protein